MEGTQPNASATRKRRSSILKSQRPPRTPFSELEFHVATPTDTGKSRRVSFSKKTGVAEFATNEATTTWKNFYEEQNRSLECSGHDSGAHAARPSVGHLGNRIFDQQFEDIEVDFADTIEMPKSLNANSSLHVNVEEQLALLECTDDKKPAAPQNNFELSMFTDNHSSKMFGDNLTNPAIGEMTERIDINFSAVQSIGTTQDVKDDLDEIEKDFSQRNIVCPGPFGEKSEYIEIDLNVTQGLIQHNNESDMSITDTIHSPKKELSKNSISIPDLKKATSKDWIEDKENIIVNPYVAPDESDNFAINEAPEKVLVFTGKKLKYADIDADLDEMEEDFEKKTPKKSFLNISERNPSANKILVYNTSVNMSMTRSVQGVIQNDKRQTIVFDNEDANADISMTQCVPSNDRLISANDDVADMSMTQAVSKDVLLQPIHKADVTKYCEEMDDMSFTKSVLAVRVDGKENIQKSQTIVFEAADAKADVSVTQYVSDVLVREIGSDKTLVFSRDDKIGDISITQAVPNGILAELLDLPEENDLAVSRRQTVHFQDADLSMTQALPSNLGNLINKSKGNTTLAELLDLPKGDDLAVSRRQTVHFQDADLSMTQAIPSNLANLINQSKGNTTLAELVDLPKSDDLAVSRRQTVHFQDADLSMTQAIPSKLATLINKSKGNTTLDELAIELELKEPSAKRVTIVFDTDEAEMSLTEAIPHLIQHSKRKTIDTADNNTKKKNSSDEADISLTQMVPKVIQPEEETNKRKTIVFEQDEGDLSMTQAIPAQVITDNKVTEIHSKLMDNIQLRKSAVFPITFIPEKPDILVYQAVAAVLSQHKADEEVNTKSVSANLSNVVDNNRSIAKTSHDISEDSVATVNPESVTERATGVTTQSNRSDPVVDSATNNTDGLNQEVYRPSVASVGTDVSAVKKDTSPSSKGDEFHLSSIKINADPDAVVAELKNPRFSHSHKASKVVAKKLALQGERKDEEAIKSLCYDEMVTSSTKIEHGALPEEPSRKSVAQETDNAKSDQNVTGGCLLTGPNDKTSFNESSLLHGLINMTDYVTEKTVDEEIPAKKGSDSDSDKVLTKSRLSSDSMFLIIKDSTDHLEIKTDEKEESLIHTRKSIKFSDETSTPEVVENKEIDDKTEQNKKNLTILQDLSREICDLSKKRFSVYNEGNTSSRNFDTEAQEIGADVTKINKTFKDADDTNELLEMLSKYTDKSIRRNDDYNTTIHGLNTDEKGNKIKRDTLEAEKSIRINDDYNKTIHGLNTDEKGNKIKRDKLEAEKSIRINDDYNKTIHGLNTDEKGNNIKRDNKTTVIHKNDIIIKAEIDEKSSRLQCFSNDSVVDSAKQSGVKKPIRMSNEVIKTLNFDDSGSGVHDTPLKKTAFAETEYTIVNIGNIIPNYDFNDGVKEIMKELVQPKVDLRFKTKSPESTCVPNKPSTCSSQIQANIVTSSQVDLPSTDSGYDLVSISSAQTGQGNKYTDSTDTDRPEKFPSEIARPLKEIINNADPWCKNEDYMQANRSPDRVVVFDQSNPLNNVLLAPIDFSDAHRYNPYGGETARNTSSRFEGKEETINRLTLEETHSNTLESGDSEETFASEGSRIRSQVNELKDTEVNTFLAMKGTQELLEASSSLTLVDDAFSSNVSTKEVITVVKNSPVEVIYTILEDAKKVDAGQENTRKRIYSPGHRKSNLSAVDVTPKPKSKQQKLSFSPDTNIHMVYDTKTSPGKNSPKKISPKKSLVPEQAVTIQPLLTKCNANPEEPNALNKQLISSLQGRSSISSYVTPITDRQSDGDDSKVVGSSSSSHHEVCRDSDVSVPMSICIKSKAFNATRSDSQPELLNERSSKNLLTECESSVNVVAKIDMLPFIGSARECEWDTASSDSWSFRLLHSRIRLVVRLAHRIDNSTRSCVRADTPLESVTVEPVRLDKQNCVGGWCVKFALAGMRHASHSGAAGDVPALLRRCAAVSRMALQWARAMQDARLRLAYTIEGDQLSLKVANIPMRRVWQVTMLVQSGACAGGRLAAPLASAVRVEALLDCSAAAAAAAAAVAAARYVPVDWGHVPRTVWKVFKYLKNLKSEELNY